MAFVRANKIVSVTKQPELSVTEVSVTPEISVTNLSVTKPQEGLCHGCKEEQPNMHTCICHLCISEGVTHASLGMKMCV